jgi:hypothetical protein
MASDKILQIVIKAKDEASKELDKLSKSLKENERMFSGMAKAGTVAFAGIGAYSAIAIKGAMGAEVAQKRLAHVLQTSSGASDEQVKSLIAQAEAMEKVGVVSADNINIMQEEAASFDLSTEAIKMLTPAAADFAVALYGINPSAEQARQAMTGLGKASQGQLELLTKKGYILGKDSEAIIKNGTEHERMTEIIKILGSNYQDLNTEMRNTAEGGMVGLSFEVGRLNDAVGTALIPALKLLSDVLVPIITNVANWIEENPKLSRNIVVATMAIAGIVAIIGTLGLILPPIIAGFTFFTTVLFGASAGTVVATGTMTAFAVAINAAIWPITLIIASIVALIAIGVLLYKNWDSIVAFAITMWENIKTTFKNGIDAVVTFFDPLLNVIEKVKNAMSSIGEGIKSSVSSAVKKITGKKASGGGVGTGGTYLVGEQGPEIFTPATTGSIVPNHRLAGAGGGMNLTINMNGTFMDDADRVAEKLGDRIIQVFKMNSRF